MLQKDVNLVSLDASWVSSASWYIINLFGLRSMYTLVLGADNAADQTKMMQDQMSGAALSMPDDLNKAFKVYFFANSYILNLKTQIDFFFYSKG